MRQRQASCRCFARSVPAAPAKDRTALADYVKVDADTPPRRGRREEP
jgi:hypothetical protein